MKALFSRASVAALGVLAVVALAGCEDREDFLADSPPPAAAPEAPAAPALPNPAGRFGAALQSLTADTPFPSRDVLSDGSCRDPWVTQAVIEVNGPYNKPTGRACDIYLYGNGSWSSYPDLVSKVRTRMAFCGDRWVTQAVLEVMARMPSSAECSIYRYGNGSWSSYQDLKMKVRAAFTTTAPAPVPAPAPTAPAPAPVPSTPSLTAPVIREAVYGGNLGPGRLKSWIYGTGLDRATAVIYGAGAAEVSVPITAEDKETRDGVLALNVVGPLGADLSRLALSSPQGRSNVVAVRNVPGVAAVELAIYSGNLGPGKLKIDISGTNMAIATEVLFGQVPNRKSVAITDDDRETDSKGRPSLEVIAPTGADLSYVVVATQGGFSNAVSVRNVPGVPTLNEAVYVSQQSDGRYVITLRGSGMKSATEVLFGQFNRKSYPVRSTDVPSDGEIRGIVVPAGADTSFIVVASQGGYSGNVSLKNVPAPCAERIAADLVLSYQNVFGREPRADEKAYWLSQNCNTDARLKNLAAMEAERLKWLATPSGRADAESITRRAVLAAYGEADGLLKLAEPLNGSTFGALLADLIQGMHNFGGPYRYVDVMPAIANYAKENPLKRAPVRDEYVALGDSFSSGEGAVSATDMANKTYWNSFVDGTYKNAGNNCHQSKYSYSMLMISELQKTRPELKINNQTCSGAVLENINGGVKQYPGLPHKQQLDAVTPKAALITVGIGGNDMGFANVLGYCVFRSDCQKWFTGRYNGNRDMAEVNMTVMYHRLVHFYGQLKTRSENAPIYVLGYPNLFNTTVDTSSWVLAQGSGFDMNEVAWVQGKLSAFNATIAKAARASGVNYVDVNTGWESFREYGLNGSWLNPFELTEQAGDGDGRGKFAFHPTVEGQRGDYEALMKQFRLFGFSNPNPQSVSAPTMANHWWTLDKMDTKETGLCGMLYPWCKPVDVVAHAPGSMTLHPAPTSKSTSGAVTINYAFKHPRDTQLDKATATYGWCEGGTTNWRGKDWFGNPWTDGSVDYVACGK